MRCVCEHAGECGLRVVRESGGRTFEICSGRAELAEEEVQRYRSIWAAIESSSGIPAAARSAPGGCSGCGSGGADAAGFAQTPIRYNRGGEDLGGLLEPELKTHKRRARGIGRSRRGERRAPFIYPGPCTYRKPRPLPWPEQIIRHLAYHVYPFDRVVWEWNLEQIKSRAELFNGRRLVSVVTDENSDSVDDVAAFLGDGFEIIHRPNDPERGELVSFPLLLQRLESTDPAECVFYAHAKGVSRRQKVRPPFGMWPAVQQWAAAGYEINLDFWPLVREHLERWAMTGPFQWRENVLRRPHYHGHHYSGTFYWFRSAHVFSRCWDRIEGSFYAAESWPGYQFKAEDVGSLFSLQSGAHLYREEYWSRTIGPALQQWRIDHERYRSESRGAERE